MTDQNRPGTDDTTPLSQGAGRDWSSSSPTQAEHTRTLPPMADSPATPAPPRRARGLSAAVLAGALVLGGAAGVGGAAWYDAWQGEDPAATSAGTAGNGTEPITASNAAAPAGSVQEVADKVLPSVVKINVVGQNGAGSGSGIILSEEGEILTNNHVVAAAANGGARITVNFNDGTTLPGTIVGTDPVTDIAVIKVEGDKDLQPAEIGSSEALDVGQKVVAVGSPYGLNATVTSGIVSALNRPVSVSREQQQPQNPFSVPQQQQPSLSTTYPAIQTDAAINPGNSGGPLVNMAGQVVGVNSSIRTAPGGAAGSIGLGFAIPINEVLPIINQIRAGEEPTHARMAVTVSDVQGGALAQGALVRSVQEGGPADEAGLRQGDVITRVNDQIIDGSESLVATIRGHRPGDEVEITYQRGDKTNTITITLGSDAEFTTS